MTPEQRPGTPQKFGPPVVTNVDLGGMNLRDLRPRKSRLMWFLSRQIGGRSILGFQDETPRKRLVIRLEEERRG